MEKDLLLEMLNDDDTPATILNAMMISIFGGQWYVWELETVYSELKRVAGVDELSDFIQDKLAAIIVLLTTDRFYNEWEVFENIGHAFNHNIVFPAQMQPLEAEEANWVIYEAELLDESFLSFSSDVKAYLRTILHTEGIVEPVDQIYEKTKIKIFPKNVVDKSEQNVKIQKIKAYKLINQRHIHDYSIKYFGKDTNDFLDY